MSDFKVLEKQLEQLGRELSRETCHAEIVVRQAKSAASQGKQNIPPQKRRTMHWRMSAALAASVAVCVGAWWWSRPTTLYARMLAALAEARTVHAAGWTREIVRKWPLEQPVTTRDQESNNEKYDMEAWYWTAPDGTPRSYERQGPVIAVRRGGDLKEYQ